VDLLGQFEQMYSMSLKSPNTSFPISPMVDDSLLDSHRPSPSFIYESFMETAPSEQNHKPLDSSNAGTTSKSIRDSSTVENPMDLAHELKDLAQAVKDRLQVQGTPKVREVELLHSIRVQYRKDLELLQDKQRRYP
jgi:hypothetical protein